MSKRKIRRAPQKFLAPEVLEATARMTLDLLSQAGIKGAVAGGYAMQIYGSPRLTGDVDLVVERVLGKSESLEPVKVITFGGKQYKTPQGVEVDLIDRKDHFRALYQEALESSVVTDDGLQVLSPEYLAVAKFVAGRPKDEDDLVWLLQQKGLVDRPAALEIVERLVGGQFAREALRSFVDEADWRSERERKKS
jgi:hypothetical protein